MKKELSANTQELFRKQNAFSMAHQTYRDCGFYPCHTLPEGQGRLNCLFCYCPFYPCDNRVGTGKWIKGKDRKKIWDCSPCSFIHRDDVSALVMELFHSGQTKEKIQKKIRKEFVKKKPETAGKNG